MKDFFKYTIVGVIIFFTCLLIMGMCGCEVIKGKKSVQSDSTHVVKAEAVKTDSTKSGIVTKTDISEMYEKWKTTLTFPRDTSVTNVYNYPRPETIVIEKEVGQKTETKSDSSWYFNFQSSVFTAIDSLNRKIDSYEKTKSSETKGVGLTLVIIIAIAAVVLGKVALPFKIVKT